MIYKKKYEQFLLIQATGTAPIWEFRDQGKEIYQEVNSAAAVAIGTARLSSVDFSGLTLTDDSDNDFIGFVFSFQDSSNFYLVYSSKSGSNQGPWKIVRVKSTNPGGLGSGMKSIKKHKILTYGFCKKSLRKNETLTS